MGKQARTLAAVAGVCLFLASCSKELKPEQRGVFAVTGGRLFEVQPAVLDSDFTAEGFTIPYFVGDPAVTARSSDLYFILYGDYKVLDIKAFQRRGERFEIDTSRSNLADTMETLGMKGEPEMVKGRFTKPLSVGTYVLDVQQAGDTLHFPFRAE